MIREKLNDFVNTERGRFSTKDNNLFGTAFSQIIRYYDFLQVIIERYGSVDEAFLANIKTSLELSKSFPSGESHSLTKEESGLLEEGVKLTTLLHLEIESFYLFAKILLDKVAKFVEFYFGQARGLSLNSHNDLSKNIESYANVKQLTSLPEKLITLIKELKKEVADYRDKMITHEWSPRTMKGTMFNLTIGGSRISSHKLYPKDGDRQVESKTPEQIICEIDEYLEEIIEYVTNNRGKTRLEALSR